MDMDSDTTARGLLRLSPRPRLIPTTLEDTMVDMVLVMPTTDMALDTTDMDSDTTARGLLRLSPRPRLIPTTLVDTMVDMVLVMPTTDMALDTMDGLGYYGKRSAEAEPEAKADPYYLGGYYGGYGLGY